MNTQTMIDVDGTVTVRELTAEELAALTPTAEQVIAARRANAVIDRETLCRALRSQGKLSDESAIEATAGRWPVEFNAATQGMTPEQVWDAKVAWAGANTVRYGNPVLQAAALAFCQGDAAAATALLDQLFGLT